MTVVYEKDPHTGQQPASTTKLMTTLVARDWIADEALGAPVTITSADTVNWSVYSNAGHVVGDVLTLRDLFYGAMLPSGGDSCKCLARVVGGLIPGGGDPTVKFIAAMNAKSADLGMTASVFYDVFGADERQRMSPSDAAKLTMAYATDSTIAAIAGTLQHAIVVAGVNARNYSVTHTIDPDGAVKLPEFVFGKTGTTPEAGPCLALFWQSPSGVKRASVVMGAASDLARYQDMRRLIDYELARMGEL